MLRYGAYQYGERKGTLPKREPRSGKQDLRQIQMLSLSCDLRSNTVQCPTQALFDLDPVFIYLGISQLI